MGVKKVDKEFLWLKVLHIIDDKMWPDIKTTDLTETHKLLKELNKVFYIKER